MNPDDEKIFKLGDVQFELMKIVWARGKATVRDVYEEMLKKRKMAHSTVLTMLRDLDRKGLLVHELRERTYVYRPTYTRKRVSMAILRDIIKRIFDGSVVALVARFVEDENISSEELKHIEELIAQQDRELGGVVINVDSKEGNA